MKQRLWYHPFRIRWCALPYNHLVCTSCSQKWLRKWAILVANVHPSSRFSCYIKIGWTVIWGCKMLQVQILILSQWTKLKSNFQVRICWRTLRMQILLGCKVPFHVASMSNLLLTPPFQHNPSISIWTISVRLHSSPPGLCYPARCYPARKNEVTLKGRRAEATARPGKCCVHPVDVFSQDLHNTSQYCAWSTTRQDLQP